jgi:hypothetical protein
MKKICFILCALVGNFNYVQASQAVHQDGWSFSFKAGIAPAVFTRTGSIESKTILQSSGRAIPSIVNFDRSDLFHFPWSLGGEVGYGLNEDIELFVSVDYFHARGKTIQLTNVPNVKGELDSFGHLGFYFGGRYYFDVAQDFVLFSGFKLGLAFVETVDVRGLGLTLGPNDPGKVSLFRNSTEFSAGMHFGGEYLVNEKLSFKLTSEIIGTTRISHRRRLGILSSTPNSVQTKIGRSPGGIFQFPIMAAIKMRV